MGWNVQDEINEHFWGYARMSISDIDVSGPPDSASGIEAMTERFRIQGCHHDLPTYAAVVTMDRRDCMDSPAIQFDPYALPAAPLQVNRDHQVSCLHGKRRLLAAKRFLGAADQWWIAKIYDTGETVRGRKGREGKR